MRKFIMLAVLSAVPGLAGAQNADTPGNTSFQLNAISVASLGNMVPPDLNLGPISGVPAIEPAAGINKRTVRPSVRSSCYWQTGAEPGSDYYWQTGAGPGSDYYWQIGAGPSLITAFPAEPLRRIPFSIFIK